MRTQTVEKKSLTAANFGPKNAVNMVYCGNDSSENPPLTLWAGEIEADSVCAAQEMEKL